MTAEFSPPRNPSSEVMITMPSGGAGLSRKGCRHCWGGIRRKNCFKTTLSERAGPLESGGGPGGPPPGRGDGGGGGPVAPGGGSGPRPPPARRLGYGAGHRRKG